MPSAWIYFPMLIFLANHKVLQLKEIYSSWKQGSEKVFTGLFENFLLVKCFRRAMSIYRARCLGVCYSFG